MSRQLALGMLGTWVAVAVAGSAGCSSKDSARDPGAAPAKTALPTPAVDPCAKAVVEGPLAWIHDDYPSALACAKAKDVPLVIDLWAPWCHTCLSMQSTVFVDPSFAPSAPKFVFVALDTDREVNAAAVAKYPLSAWPTFYVVGPDEAVLARFIGAASVAQFHALLATAAQARAGGAAGADGHLLAAERALAGKDFAAADRELTAALAAAPETWPRRPDALVSLISTRSKAGDTAGCLALAEASLDATGNAASASDFMYHAMTCATAELGKPGAAPAIAARVRALRERAAARWTALLADTATPMSVDDRSDAMANLRETLLLLDKKPEATAVAQRQRALLDEAAARALAAKDPTAASTFNWPRAEVYVFLGVPLELVPALEQSAKDLPDEYDPRSRLGWVYLQAGKLAEAARWTDDALRLVYGPRKARVLTQRIEIAVKLADRDAERRYRRELVALYAALPAGQAAPDAVAKAKQALADVEATATGSGSGSGSGSGR